MAKETMNINNENKENKVELMKKAFPNADGVKPSKSSLNTEQLALLETLTYLDDEKPFKKILKAEPGQTIESFLMSMNGVIEDDKMYHSFISGRDWKRVITRVLRDKDLCNMKIMARNSDEKYNGESVLFVKDGNEAVFAYRGTAPREWEDNVKGASPEDEKTSTECQDLALEWYQNTCEDLKLDNCYKTVIGHSKGGNKAKFITIQDDSVDQCVSFDGQGFSDEFIMDNEDKISKNQHKIHNHNINNDFVNILLNDIGEATFYNGFEVGSFARNHCPHVFLDVTREAHMEENKAGRNPILTTAHDLLNSFCRTITPEEKRGTISTIAGALSAFMGKMEENKREAIRNGEVKDTANKLVGELGMIDKKVEAAAKEAEEERRNNMTLYEKFVEWRANKAKEEAEKAKSPVKPALAAIANTPNGVKHLGRVIAFAKQFMLDDKANEKLFEDTIKTAINGKDKEENKNRGWFSTKFAEFKGWAAAKAIKFAIKHPGVITLASPIIGYKLQLSDEEQSVVSNLSSAIKEADAAGFDMMEGTNMKVAEAQKEIKKEAEKEHSGEKADFKQLNDEDIIETGRNAIGRVSSRLSVSVDASNDMDKSYNL